MVPERRDGPQGKTGPRRPRLPGKRECSPSPGLRRRASIRSIMCSTRSNRHSTGSTTVATDNASPVARRSTTLAWPTNRWRGSAPAVRRSATTDGLLQIAGACDCREACDRPDRFPLACHWSAPWSAGIVSRRPPAGRLRRVASGQCWPKPPTRPRDGDLSGMSPATRVRK